jgi:pilus assembly protein CpaE
MAIIPSFSDASRQSDWPWKAGLVLETPELASEINSALAEAGCAPVFELRPSASSFEIANAVERERPDVLFAELSRTSKPAAEWMADIRHEDGTPLVVAVHSAPEPSEMIAALRAGAGEFISPPVRPAIYEAMERIGSQLETKQSRTVERGKILGVLSAKGGCGATTIACYLGAALASTNSAMRVLIADLDYQSPGAHDIFRVAPRGDAAAAFASVRRLNLSVWREFVTTAASGVDLLAGSGGPQPAAPEQWRAESLFRFISRQYSWVLADLGRHLNPANWMLLQNIDELLVVTAPDVLALYQTRSILQTLSSRGFDKGRIRIVLNRNVSSPQDFWVESIEQMFEMTVFGVVPNNATQADLKSVEGGFLQKPPRDQFEFPAGTPFGQALMKLAGRLLKPNTPGSAKKAA